MFIDSGLKERGNKDLQLVMDVCVAISKIGAIKTNSNDGEESFPGIKYDREHDLFVNLAEILVHSIEDKNTCHYIPMAQKAILVIYQLSEQPDGICADILRRICERYKIKTEIFEDKLELEEDEEEK